MGEEEDSGILSKMEVADPYNLNSSVAPVGIRREIISQCFLYWSHSVWGHMWVYSDGFYCKNFSEFLLTYLQWLGFQTTVEVLNAVVGIYLQWLGFLPPGNVPTGLASKC